VAEDGESARRDVPGDLALLDRGPPGIDGHTIARRLQQSGEIGIIFVTGADSPTAIRAGFDVGGDDYVAKPFEPAILMWRVRAILRRVGKGTRVGRSAIYSSTRRSAA